LGVAWIVFRGRAAPLTQLSAVAWIGTVFLCYRIGLWAVAYEGECSCLGHLADPLGVSPSTADWVAKGMLAYLLAGSACFLWLWRRRGLADTAMSRETVGDESA
jgi:hypothetical protein